MQLELAFLFFLSMQHLMMLYMRRGKGKDKQSMTNMWKNSQHRLVFAGCVLVTLIIAVIWLPAASAEQTSVLTYTLNGTEATITSCDTNATSEQVAAAFDEICR
jgi:hypothetical protein